MSRGLVSLGDRSFEFSNRRTPRPPGGGAPWYSEGVTVRKVDENSTALSVTNSTAETVVASLTLPALVLSSTGAARLSVTGTVLNGTTHDFTLRMKVADAASTATVLATSAIDTASNASPHAWSMEAWLFGKQPNINRAWGVLDVAQAGASATMKPSTFSAVGFSTMGLDESEEWTISITAQLSSVSTGITFTREVAILEAIN